MRKKATALEALVASAHPNKVLMQLQLQGIVSLQVNSGPMEFANVFLAHPETYDVNRLDV